MSADIDALQERLGKHFQVLSDARRALGLPVFTLEHGLSDVEVSSLTLLLEAKLNSPGYKLSRHWLVWVVFATEQGYDYDGDEYWHTFEQRMPGWDHGWRPSLRSWFEKFHTKFGSLRPVGRWANFFSIIAWPITQALLPKDLQSQLARELYRLRYQLVSRLDRPAAEVGRYVARMTHGGSSRYENFLEQEDLVGSIVLGLLVQRAPGAESAILPATLTRIVRDLEKARNARQWLHDTRKAIEVSTLRGTASRAGDSAGRTPVQPPERRPVIRPSLLLRRTSASAWTPIVEIPSFREVADLSPDLGSFLKRSRCSVAGSPGFRPPGWLLAGAQRRVLGSWPEAGKPVLSFQTANTVMDHLLASEGCIQSGPDWLFRVGSDGQANEALGRLVRPGQSYVLVSRATLPDLSIAVPVQILCSGVVAIRFDLPPALSEALIAELKKARLSVAETIRVWPAGLAARGWDGEGATEWLENECPCFAIDHDHPVARYVLRLGSGASLEVPAQAPGIPTFVRLKPLPAGNHILSISVVASSSSSEPTRPAEGVISLAVRPPNPWISGTIGHTGLIVSSEPPEPTLDEFWEGLTRLTVMGPGGRQVTVCVELLDGAGGRLALEQVGQLALPLGEDTWRNAYATFARRDKDPWSYLSAAAGRIIIDGEDLGSVHVPLQRDASPVRWVWHNTNRSTRLRLVDDHDAETPLHVAFHPYSAPLEASVLSAEEVTAGLEPSAPGGLFIARYADHSAALVVSARKVDGGLGGLIVEPVFTEPRYQAEEALILIGAIRDWTRARLIGALAAERRDCIVARLKEQLYAVLCGPNWARAERNLRLGVPHDAAVEGLIRCFADKRTFGYVLAHDAARYAAMPEHVRQREFAALAQRYHVTPGAASRPALDLVEVTEDKLRLDDAELMTLISQLWNRPALTAGARLIQLFGKGSAAPQRAALKAAAR